MNLCNLEELRVLIRKTDEQLVALLNERARLSKDVGLLKNSQRRQIYDPSQEARVLEHLAAINQGPVLTQSLKAIFREIISASRTLQEPLQVFCLGPEASFSHLAAERYFGSSTIFSCQNSIRGVFQETMKAEGRLGVVPIENSLEGSVNLTLDGLVETKLNIQAEILMRISHCLLSAAESQADLLKVYSHPQALAQCQGWLKDHLPNCRLIGTESTAAAAQMVAGDVKSAAIGSLMAAERYALNVLEEGIEDNEHNITRFLVIGKGQSAATDNDKTSIIFSTPHRPGALHLALKSFADRQINLIKIQSHPIKGRLWEYLFFVDFAGHIDNGAVGQCLAELANHTTLLKILGSYPQGEAMS